MIPCSLLSGERPGADQQETLRTPRPPLSRGPGRPVFPEARAGQYFPAGWPQGLPRSLHLPPPALGPQQCVCKSLREHWLPRHRLAGSQVWCYGSCTSQEGWQEGLVNPLEKAPWLTERSGCLLPQGHGTPYPRVFQASLVPQCSAHTPSMLGLGSQLGL